MLALVVFRADIHVFLAVPQHRLDDTGQLWAIAVIALGTPSCAIFRRRKAAKRRALAARLALGLVLDLITMHRRRTKYRTGSPLSRSVRS